MTIFRSMGLSMTIQMWIVLNKKLTFWRYSKILKNPDPNGESWYGSWWFMALGLPPSDFMTGWLHDCLRALLASGLDVGAWVVPKWLCWKKHGKMNVFFSNLGKTRQMLFLETWSTVGLKSNFCERVWLKITKKRDGMAPNMVGTHVHQTWKNHHLSPTQGWFFLGFVSSLQINFRKKAFTQEANFKIWRWNRLKMGYP
jgi:hypothetical protein